eukprot:m.808201 g.808201  ORF g.808201 m.808201 type:complete len:103 (+) comp59311_c1_seq2:377-685(+)
MLRSYSSAWCLQALSIASQLSDSQSPEQRELTSPTTPAQQATVTIPEDDLTTELPTSLPTTPRQSTTTASPVTLIGTSQILNTTELRSSIAEMLPADRRVRG